MYQWIRIFGIKINTFSVLLLFSLFFCFLAVIYDKQLKFEYHKYIFESFKYAFICAGFGGKLLYGLTIVINNGFNLHWKYYLNGFVFYGAMIGGVVGILYYSNDNYIHCLDLLDVYTRVLPLGQAIGRIGCYCNGCCYGKKTTGFIGIRYIVDGDKIKVIPTWFMESLFCLGIFIILAKARCRFRGFFSGIYFITYGIFRFVIEFYRGDEIRGVWRGVSTSQVICIFVVAVGIRILIRGRKHVIENDVYENVR